MTVIHCSVSVTHMQISCSPPIHSPTHTHFETSYPSRTRTYANKHALSTPAYLPMRSHVGFLTEWGCQGNGEEMTQGIFSQISPVGILRSGTGPVSSLSPQFSHQTQSECQTHWDTLVPRQEGRQRETSTERNSVCAEVSERAGEWKCELRPRQREKKRTMAARTSQKELNCGAINTFLM